jgi:outer membrane beta-barrel protein/carboxypeptidase-like protein
MKRLISCLSLLFFCFISQAQNITIRGKIIEKSTNLPMESATVYLTTVKDSTIVDYTISDKNGAFSLSTKKIKQPVFLKVSYIGFTDYRQQIDALITDKDFGKIEIEESPKSLDEVVIKSEAPPVRIKQDTLEFNASSFKVRPDANVESLLKQLPGVEIDASGKITVNGKEVNNILVNGKPFFGKDGKIATENLPAEIIDKVQVTDTKTKEEELSGQAASSDEKTINLTIQKDKNKGLFGKFSAGKGSDDRYEASGLINYFKDEQKFSFLGSANNVNSIGFSMDEIFDSMGGGRNVYTSGDGSFNIDGQQYGGGNGITQSGLTGVNYADQFGKKIEANGSYMYTNAKTENVYKSRTETLLTDDTPGNESFITEAAGTTNRFSEGQSFNGELEYKIDSLTTISFRPRIKKNISRNKNTHTNSSTNDLGKVYDNSGSDHSTGRDGEFGNEFYLNKSFKKKGRTLGFTFNNENSSNESDAFTDSETFYYQDPDRPDDIRHQRQLDHSRLDEYYTRIGYSEPITDSLSMTLRVSYKWRDSGKDKQTFSRNNVTGQYNNFQDLFSYGLQTNMQNVIPSASFYVRKKKYSLGFTGGIMFTDLQNSRDYLGTRKVLDQNYSNFSGSGWFNYNLTKSKSIYMYYNYDVLMPSADQLLIQDFTSPLTEITGNEKLKPSKAHNVYLNFNNYDYPKRSGFYLYSGINYSIDNIVTTSNFDTDNLINRVSYTNIDNSYSGYLGFNYDKTFKFGAHKLKTSVGATANYNYNKGLTNNKLYKAFGFALNPDVRLSYEYGEILTIAPSYRYEFNQTNYTNYSIDKSSAFRHVFKTEATVRWPKGIVFGADMGYTYNANIADGFKKDFYLLNTSLGYNFLNDKLLAKVKVYDILNQNINSSRTITPEYIADMQNTVLKRYVMFSLTYKIEKFGGKKKNEWEMEE